MEKLEGENQYEADGHGKQDAEKGLRFAAFPPVLSIHLKRFEYDPHRDGMVKVNDRFEFSPRLELDQYLTADADRSVPSNYRLHSVLVHSGDVHGGHYYVYICMFGKKSKKCGEQSKGENEKMEGPGEDAPDTKQNEVKVQGGQEAEKGADIEIIDNKDDRKDGDDSNNGRWFKFDDETVTNAKVEQAIDGNFGGEMFAGRDGDGPPTKRLRPAYKNFSSAYMLVYIREDLLHTPDGAGTGGNELSLSVPVATFLFALLFFLLA